MTRFLRAPVRASALLAAVSLAAGGCNVLLGNDSGDPLDASVAVVATVDASLLEEASVPPDAALPVPDSAVPDAAGPCAPGQKICFGQCVSITDPLYGCDVDACVPCQTNRATSICAGARCAVGACDTGYADCDQKGTNGCETDLSQTTHCGSCNAVCQVAAPYCAPSGASFACSTNCPAQAPTLCGAQCVDLTTSESHCGDCNTPCPVVLNGRETCAARQCQLSCDASFHKCGNSCVSNVDPVTCGASCTPCAAPANATATCSPAGQCGWMCKPGFHACGASCLSNDDVASCGASSCAPCPSANATPSCTAGVCGFVCAPGSGNCDKNAANACETNTQIDGNNCGTCGLSCSGNPCVGGQCQIPDAGPPDTGPPDTGPADTGPG
jgi:hypothetical protein